MSLCASPDIHGRCAVGRLKRAAAWILAVGLASGASGCAPVPVWARASLLTPAMAGPGSGAGGAMRAHVREVRQPAARTGGGGGAACGCN